MKRQLDSLAQLARLALKASASEDALQEAAAILRRGTGATRAAVVYVRNEEGFLMRQDGDEGAEMEFSQIGVWILQREVVQTDGPVGFNLNGHRLEEFAPAESEQRDFMAFAIPFSGTAAEMCILQGPWDEKGWRAALGFVERALASLAVLVRRVLDVDEARRQRNQLAALANAGQVLTRSEDMEGALRNMATALAASTGYDFVSIDVYDASADRFILRVLNEQRMSGGEQAQFWRGSFDPDRPHLAYLQVVRTREPLLMLDLQNDERMPERFREFFQRAQLRSAALLPMLFRDEVLGVMAVVSFQPLTFSDEEIRLLESLAAEVASALKALRSHRELVESRERLQRYAQRIERQRVKLAKSQAQLEEKSTQLERALEAERERGRHDALTGLLNHAAIVDELRCLISDGPDGTRCAVAMIDVDHLKATNDTFGHQVGDAVLVAIAHATTRDGALVGRYGGDEFVAVLPGAGRAAAERYRDEIVKELAGITLYDPNTATNVPVLVSVGLATYPAEAARIEELIDVADSGMYAAKRQRPAGSAGGPVSQTLGSDLAAKMVGEIVPLLTSPGDLSDKLQLVAHRLSVAAGYDAVNFGLFTPQSDTPVEMSTFAQVPDELLAKWICDQRRDGSDKHPIRILMAHGRPLMFDDPQHDTRLTDIERAMLRAAGLRSALAAPMLWRNDLIGILSVASRREAAFTPRDAQFLMAVASQVTAIVRMSTLVEELQSATDRLAAARTETVMMLAAAAEAHDHATGLHLQNVRTLTEKLARELGHRGEDCRELGLAAVLHDIGKVRVPEVVLSTVGQLTDHEWDLLKQHTVWGDEFLRGRPGFGLAATIARSHHEHWDGRGYPDGLAGEAIPEAATIVAVADSFDAMTSDRPYRAGRSINEALREIEACSGKQFSPRVADAIVRLHERKLLGRGPSDAPDQKAAA